MTTTIITEPRITPEVTATFRAERIAYWRNEARENWTLGFMDLARTCEGFASAWEWNTVPCDAVAEARGRCWPDLGEPRGIEL